MIIALVQNKKPNAPVLEYKHILEFFSVDSGYFWIFKCFPTNVVIITS